MMVIILSKNSPILLVRTTILLAGTPKAFATSICRSKGMPWYHFTFGPIFCFLVVLHGIQRYRIVFKPKPLTAPYDIATRRTERGSQVEWDREKWQADMGGRYRWRRLPYERDGHAHWEIGVAIGFNIWLQALKNTVYPLLSPPSPPPFSGEER